MYRHIRLAAAVLSLSLAGTIMARADGEMLNKLIQSYESVTTVTCSVRKTSKAAERTVRMMSRVHYKKDGFIHVENVTPSRRRIIADGKTLYYHDSNAEKGFSSPIADLDENWSSSLNTVPASPLDHLLKLRDMKAGKSSKSNDSMTYAFHGEKNHVRLTVDAKGRVSSLAFFKDAELKSRYAFYSYSEFINAGPAWLAGRHEAELVLPDGSKATEVRIFENVSVGKEIPDRLFDHTLFMKDVEFVPNFEDTWK